MVNINNTLEKCVYLVDLVISKKEFIGFYMKITSKFFVVSPRFLNFFPLNNSLGNYYFFPVLIPQGGNYYGRGIIQPFTVLNI